tara:strand:- start:15492 stop:15740 length:249 start_codon:yes stop_codon:yes gene_type:complete
MGFLVGRWKKSSGVGKPTTTTPRKAALAIVAVHLGLILFFVSCIHRLTSWYKKTEKDFNDRWKPTKNIDIIDVEYEVKNENE